MRKKYIYASMAVLMWSTMAPLVKTLLGNIPNLQALSVSSFFAVASLIAVSFFNGSFKQFKAYGAKDYGKMTALGFLGIFLYSVLYYFGLSQLTSQEACIANYLWPVMLVAFSCAILKEKLTVKKFAAMASSFVGIIILTSGGGAASGGNRLAGLTACIVAAALYGLFSVLNKKADFNQSVSMTVFWLTSAVGALIMGLCTEKWVALDAKQWIGLLALGVACDGLAYLLWAIALKGGNNTASVANLAYLVPFLSIVIAAIFLKEQIKPTAIVALIFIIGGIVFQNIHFKKRSAQLN